MKRMPVFPAHAVRLSREHMHEGAGGPFGAVIARDVEGSRRGLEPGDLGQRPDRACGDRGYPPGLQGRGGFFAEGPPRCSYTSCEPCPMCLASAYWARVSRIVYANSRADAAAIGFDDSFLYDEIPKAPQERSLPIEHHPSAGCEGRVSRPWLNKPDRIPY